MIIEPTCHTRGCKHLQGVKSPDMNEELGEFVFCKAFPDGIPDEIAYGNNDHSMPFPGDHGIQYEKGESE